MKRILFVDDEPMILQGLQRMLRSQRREWDMKFALGPRAALEELTVAPFDVVVTDMRMPEMDGAALLAEVQRRHPATVRIVLSGYSDTEASTRATYVAHQFLNKPCSAEMLKEAIERTSTLKEQAPSDAVREVVGGIDTLPTIPKLYQNISSLLSVPEPSLLEVVSVLEQDVGIAAKLLQMVNSSFFGTGRRVTTVRGAVDLLGIRIVQGLVLSAESFRTFEVQSEVQGFRVDDLRMHSLSVAALARRMVAEREAADTAHTAGLLHDVGKLVLVHRIPLDYERIIRTALDTGAPLHQVERDELGVTHAEVGAFLFGLWNLPETVVRAVAGHHSPGEMQGPLELNEVICIADALLHEVRSIAAPGGRHDAHGSMDVLEQPGIADRLPVWRNLVVDGTGESDAGGRAGTGPDRQCG